MGRILVVADADKVRDELVARIATGPHTVRAIAPGDLHIEAAREWDPDVIVMNLATDSSVLPIRIGMLRDPALSGVPLVALGESEEEARAIGAQAFLRTPPHMESLMELLSRLAAIRFPLPA